VDAGSAGLYDNGSRDAEQDAQGRFVVFDGERVDFDSTQKNAAGDICAWSLKLTMQGTGNFSVRSRIDGVDSNTLEMRVRAQ
jgi:hypothetical protein